MKFLKGLLIAFVVLVILIFVGAYFFIKSFDVDKYRPQIAAEVSNQVGRTVTIEKLGLNLSLIKGVYAQARGFSIREDGAFGQGDFLTVGSVELNVDVMAYLSKKEIVVSKVVISDLNVSVVRDAQGVMNVQKIGPNVPSSAAPTTVTTEPTAAPAALPKFSVQSIVVENGALRFVDKAATLPLDIVVSDIDFNVTNFTLDGPFDFQGRFAVLGGAQNLVLTGQAVIEISSQAVSLSNVEVELDLVKTALVDLLKVAPGLEAAGLTEPVQGKIIVRVPSLKAGAQGLGDLVVNGKISDVRVVTKLLPLPIEKINLDAIVDAKDVTVNQFSFHLSTGVVAGSAKITDYMSAMGMNAQIKIDALPLDAMVANLPDGMKLAGGINAQLALAGEKLADPEVFLNSLNGSGGFEVKDGKIENFNLLKTVLDKVPGLGGALESSIPEQYRAEYALNQTLFQKISSSLKITNGVADLPDITVLASLFEAYLSATVDTKLVGKVAGEIKIPTDLSETLTAKNEGLIYFRDSDGKITFPLTSFEGPLASLKIMPDLKEFGKVAVKAEGKRRLGELINKALGTEGSPSSDGTGEAGQPGSNTGEQIIGGVLDKLFK